MYRIIANGISFYCTLRDIMEGVGDITTFNNAIKEALVRMGDNHGIATSISAVDDFGNAVVYDIQIDRN